MCGHGSNAIRLDGACDGRASHICQFRKTRDADGCLSVKALAIEPALAGDDQVCAADAVCESDCSRDNIEAGLQLGGAERDQARAHAPRRTGARSLPKVEPELFGAVVREMIQRGVEHFTRFRRRAFLRAEHMGGSRGPAERAVHVVRAGELGAFHAPPHFE
jgi:hypothetical protein